MVSLLFALSTATYYESSVIYEGVCPMNAYFRGNEILVTEADRLVAPKLIAINVLKTEKRASGAQLPANNSVSAVLESDENSDTVVWVDKNDHWTNSYTLHHLNSERYSLAGTYKNAAILTHGRNEIYAVTQFGEQIIFQNDNPIKFVSVSERGILVTEVGGIVTWIR
ncbi:MAG: hypothetical protein KF824_02615 [Fimbriimonadaceae bacterium]|nr:MAG: hypothetical protein KF824_02615 [Fimbriimonadaceae bacterium]